MRRYWRPAVALLSASVAAGALAACGGSSSTTTPTASSQATSQQRAVAALTQFAGCMRSHGIPVPDPNAQGQISGSQQLQQQYQASPQAQVALHACRQYLQNAVTQLTPANTAQYRHAQLLFARCMREHGIPIADPDPTGQLHIDPQTVNKASPQFQRAARACLYLNQQGGHQLSIGK
jgi:hypothetical protein